MMADTCTCVVGTVRNGRSSVHTFGAEQIESFTDMVLSEMMDGTAFQEWEFALGFAAAVDAFAAATIDFRDPVGTVIAARNDVFDASGAPCRVTDLMRRLPEKRVVHHGC